MKCLTAPTKIKFLVGAIFLLEQKNGIWPMHADAIENASDI